MFQTIIKKTLRIPTGTPMPGNGEQVARQLDVALMNVGFKLSREALAHYSTQSPVLVEEQGKLVLAAVRTLVGDHVKHNVYFINFPNGVPGTPTFWCQEILRLLVTGETRYGRYQHSYEDMLAAHSEFLPSLADRVTILHLGDTLAREQQTLYFQLAGSSIPLNEDDRTLLVSLAERCVGGAQPESIPIRENKALINALRIRHGQAIIADTITDILRLACALSDGDVTLETRTAFRSFPRAIRRALLTELEVILVHAPGQRADIHQYAERWKRLGERLHPHEYTQLYPYAAMLFAVARGEQHVTTLESLIEQAFVYGHATQAIALLQTHPGKLMRSVDRILRLPQTSAGDDLLVTLKAFPEILAQVSSRVLLGLREHLTNRSHQQAKRMFTNRSGKAWVTDNTLPPLRAYQVRTLCFYIDEEIQRRMPACTHLVVDPAILSVAVPLSGKQTSSGYGVLPRGSTMELGNGTIRFFVYWKQKTARTDYDLSALLLDKDFQAVGQLSWTNLRTYGAVHSGDLTDAARGATEFIDLDLSLLQQGDLLRRAATFIVPQINIFAGEKFTEVEECFFGLMRRTPEQQGAPFEPRSVQFKSDLRGSGRVALPLVLAQGATQWQATWLHLYLKGDPNFNRVEGNRLSTALLTRSIVEREYLHMDYIVALLRQKADAFAWYTPGMELTNDTTFLGLETPEGLPKEAVAYTLATLPALVATRQLAVSRVY